MANVTHPFPEQCISTNNRIASCELCRLQRKACTKEAGGCQRCKSKNVCCVYTKNSFRNQAFQRLKNRKTLSPTACALCRLERKACTKDVDGCHRCVKLDVPCHYGESSSGAVQAPALPGAVHITESSSSMSTADRLIESHDSFVKSDSTSANIPQPTSTMPFLNILSPTSDSSLSSSPAAISPQSQSGTLLQHTDIGNVNLDLTTLGIPWNLGASETSCHPIPPANDVYLLNWLCPHAPIVSSEETSLILLPQMSDSNRFDFLNEDMNNWLTLPMADSYGMDFNSAFNTELIGDIPFE